MIGGIIRSCEMHDLMHVARYVGGDKDYIREGHDDSEGESTINGSTPHVVIDSYCLDNKKVSGLLARGCSGLSIQNSWSVIRACMLCILKTHPSRSCRNHLTLYVCSWLKALPESVCELCYLQRLNLRECISLKT
ncbi:hypothetical protein NL676_003480 [Syzygium grande]|nr:hypothetical protein NL676_003480 [Syzygium grande]